MRSELELNLMMLGPVKKIFCSIVSLCFTYGLHWNLVTIKKKENTFNYRKLANVENISELISVSNKFC